MNDVAGLAGVSIKTVSRVVNDEPGVHPATADRVLAAIDQLGFRRNLSARHLRRGGETGVVGVVLENLANPFYSTLTRAVERVAQEHGRQVLTGSSDRDAAREREIAMEFCARRVDGMVVVPVGPSYGYLARESEAGTPVVFADRPGGEIDVDTVLLDNAGGAALAVGHLASYGHRSIAFLGDTADVHTADERLRGFRDGCAGAGIPFDPRLVAMGPHTAESVARALAGMPHATALVTGNNRITVHALRAFAGMARRPALVGFDDFELSDLLDPPVTVVAGDTEALGRLAADMLFTRLDGDSAPPRRLVLPTRLVPRGSGEEAP